MIVPVKAMERAKTRLALPSRERAELARAMALDTVEVACAAATAVVVVTDDSDVAAEAVRLGATVVADVPAAGQNAALEYGAGYVLGRDPGCGVAALSADLPALHADELALALRAVRSGRAFVTDAAGSGTTLLAAGPGVPLAPAFGPGSRERHLASGAVELVVPTAGLRRDVDTIRDLAAALGIGVGRRTAAAAPLAWR